MNIKQLGMNCQKLRVRHGIRQVRVAVDLGYSVENISMFEHGRNNNLRAFIWYLSKCTSWEEVKGLMEGVNDDE